MKKSVYRLLRRVGIKVERFRDPYRDLVWLAGDGVQRVVDGGAYQGAASKAFLQMFPDADVHAFEPQQYLCEKLRSESRDFPRWHVHNLALAAEKGESRFFVPESAFTASLLVPGQSFGTHEETIVSTTTLDAWASEHGSADVLKLDLQGAEKRALLGAKVMLREVRVVLCEVNFVRRYHDCAVFHEVASVLEDAGLSMFRLYEIHGDKDGRWLFADCIFARLK